MCVCMCVCVGVFIHPLSSCVLSLIEDKTQSKIGEKDRPGEAVRGGGEGGYNLKGKCK